MSFDFVSSFSAKSVVIWSSPFFVASLAVSLSVIDYGCHAEPSAEVAMIHWIFMIHRIAIFAIQFPFDARCDFLDVFAAETFFPYLFVVVMVITGVAYFLVAIKLRDSFYFLTLRAPLFFWSIKNIVL